MPFPGFDGDDPAGVLLAWTAPLERALDAAALDALAGAGGGEDDGSLVAVLVTEPARSTYPALPVREDEGEFVVWLTRVPHLKGALAARGVAIPDAVGRCLREPPTVATLTPTPRSGLR